ncbi:class I SAM-dependent methyltransferase [Variovorax paradoxus]|nr:class I SAM-dependent methyltransferase [Variovorax paradoxus]MBT2302313.1 class I SAM-dependent methyltransferase [Variovorax paradoxus]
MTGFSADWLALREPFDRAARSASAALLDLQAAAVRLRDDPVLRVIDLGCGTGANLRELAPRLGGAQQWLMIDDDPHLLAALPEALEAPGWHASVRPLPLDLALALAAVPYLEARLVTASALLDLVSASWLDALLAHVRAANAAALFALNVDGRVAWEPGLAGDVEVHELFAAHQRRDKGFGPALGAEAAALAVARLDALGYRVTQAQSDWCIEEPAMLRAMIEGMADAALEQDPAAEERVGAWTARRLELVDRTCLRVGHVDLLAMP